MAAFSDTRTNIRYKNNSAEGVGLQGTTQNYLDIQGLDIKSGRMFTESEVRANANVVVLGQTIGRVFI